MQAAPCTPIQNNLHDIKPAVWKTPCIRKQRGEGGGEGNEKKFVYTYLLVYVASSSGIGDMAHLWSKLGGWGRQSLTFCTFCILNHVHTHYSLLIQYITISNAYILLPLVTVCLFLFLIKKCW